MPRCERKLHAVHSWLAGAGVFLGAIELLARVSRAYAELLHAVGTLVQDSAMPIECAVAC